MNRRYALIALTVLALNGCRQGSSSRATPKLETHYAPSENLEALDADAFDHARHTIDIAAYNMTDFALGNAIRRAALRGVQVRLYLDRGQTTGELNREQRRAESEEGEDFVAPTGVLQQLAGTPNVEIRVKHSKTLMHLKSYDVDEVLLRSGSANFSPTGEKRQDNDLLFIRNADALSHFHDNFERAWARADNENLTNK